MQDPIILYDNRLEDGTPIASSTASGYDVLNLKDFRDYTYWKANNTTTPCYITVDCGSAQDADCLGILKHNFNTISASISVECSSDNFSGDTTVALSAFSPSSDLVIFKTFTNQNKRYWRLKINGSLSAAPYMAVLMIGKKLDVPFPLKAPFSPAVEGIEAETSRSKTGHILGTVLKYRSISIKATIIRPTWTWMFNTFKPVWDSHISQLKPFFWAWDYDDYPNDVYLVVWKKSSKYKTPLSILTELDTFTFDMEGIVE